MLQKPSPSPTQNRLLAALSDEDLEPLQPLLSLVEWKFGDVLVLPNRPVDNVWFPIRGLASVLAVTAAGRTFEVGLYGREGAGPAQVLLGMDQVPHTHVVQAPGLAYALPKVELKAAMDRRVTLSQLLMRYVDAFAVQTGSTALSNSKDALNVRLARWLLMYQDRLDPEDLPITARSLCIMLGATTESVVSAMADLQSDGMIQSSQDHVRILNRLKLLDLAAGSYGVPEQEFDRLIGSAPAILARPGMQA